MTLKLKNVYIDKLHGTVNRYNNTYITIKRMPVDVKSRTYTDFDKRKTIKKIVNLNLMLG